MRFCDLSRRTKNVIRNILGIPWSIEPDDLSDDQYSKLHEVMEPLDRFCWPNCGKVTKRELAVFLGQEPANNREVDHHYFAEGFWVALGTALNQHNWDECLRIADIFAGHVLALKREHETWAKQRDTIVKANEDIERAYMDPRSRRFEARNYAIFHLVILDGFYIREVGRYFGISIERARQIVHKISRECGWRSYRDGGKLSDMRRFFGDVREAGRDRPDPARRDEARGPPVAEQ